MNLQVVLAGQNSREPVKHKHFTIDTPIVVVKVQEMPPQSPFGLRLQMGLWCITCTNMLRRSLQTWHVCTPQIMSRVLELKAKRELQGDAVRLMREVIRAILRGSDAEDQIKVV